MDRLEEIKARHDLARESPVRRASVFFNDMDWLIAEVERLRAGRSSLLRYVAHYRNRLADAQAGARRLRGELAEWKQRHFRVVAIWSKEMVDLAAQVRGALDETDRWKEAAKRLKKTCGKGFRKAQSERDTYKAKLENILCAEHARPEGLYSGCLHCALQEQSAWWGKLDDTYMVLTTEKDIVEQVLADRVEREELKSDRGSEARKAESWFQRCSELEAENARLRTHAFALEQRLANRDNQSFVRDISQGHSIDNAVDAFVKTAAERDGLREQLLRREGELAAFQVQARDHRAFVESSSALSARVEGKWVEEMDELKKQLAECQQENNELRGQVSMTNETAEYEEMELRHQLAECRVEVARLRKVLERLAQLGNEPFEGNSVGNRIAQAALASEDKADTADADNWWSNRRQGDAERDIVAASIRLYRAFYHGTPGECDEAEDAWDAAVVKLAGEATDEPAKVEAANEATACTWCDGTGWRNDYPTDLDELSKPCRFCGGTGKEHADG